MWTFAYQIGFSAESGAGDQAASLINFEEEKNTHAWSKDRNLTFVTWKSSIFDNKMSKYENKIGVANFTLLFTMASLIVLELTEIGLIEM